VGKKTKSDGIWDFSILFDLFGLVKNTAGSGEDLLDVTEDHSEIHRMPTRKPAVVDTIYFPGSKPGFIKFNGPWLQTGKQKWSNDSLDLYWHDIVVPTPKNANNHN
jgi:hypothetical protein